jgi:predicted branched-subunit amino acid permease
MLVDQNYAATMTKGRFRPDVDVIPYYMGCWLALASVWQLSNIAGALLGPLVPTSWGLDFAVPLVFLALLAPTLKDRTAVGVAVVTGVASAVLVPVLPMQSGLVVALVLGMLYGAWRDRPTYAEEHAG